VIDLEAKAAELRRTVLETALKAGKGHIPPALSWVEIAVALYYGGILNYGGGDERDRFILSKGHGCLTLYAVLADLGFIDKNTLSEFAQSGALLAGHPDTEISGVDACSGSLGHGLGVGAGMAFSARLSGKSWRTFVVLGDGELNEGSVWEAAMFAGHHRLNNLTAIVDYNKLCSANWTRDIIDGSWFQRFVAFGWDAEICDGHSINRLVGKLLYPHLVDQPHIIFASTTKGRGIPFMEASPLWHHRIPKGDEIEQARRALA
jgi:transketolase